MCPRSETQGLNFYSRPSTVLVRLFCLTILLLYASYYSNYIALLQVLH